MGSSVSRIGPSFVPQLRHFFLEPIKKQVGAGERERRMQLDMTSNGQAEPHGHVSKHLHRHWVWAEKSKEADHRSKLSSQLHKITHASTYVSGGYR